MKRTATLPIHLAISSLGVARAQPDGAILRSELGPYVDALANVFERVTVLAYDPPAAPRHAEDVADHLVGRSNVDVLSLGTKGTWRDHPSRSTRVRAIVSEASEAWDVLVVRFDRRAHLVWSGNRCTRTVAMLHGHAGVVPERGLAFRDRLLSFRTKRHAQRIVASSGLLVTDGEAYLEAFARFADHAELIRHSARPARRTYRAADRLDGPAPRFLFVGRVTDRKGILETIASFAAIRSELLPFATIDVVGEGAELPEARELAKRLGLEGAVTFHGALPPDEPLFSLYRNADVLLFLSRSESFPRVVTEAMAHSVLVVSTAVGSLPAAFSSERELLFVEPDPPSVVAAVRKLHEHSSLRREVIDNAYRWAEQTSLEEVVNALAAAIVRRWPELMKEDAVP